MLSRKYSADEKLAYIEKFRKQKVSQAQFAKENNIPATTFGGWLKLERESIFGEINLKPAVTKQDELTVVPKVRDTIVIEKEDMKIELKKGFDKEFLRKIVEVLIYAN